MEETKENEIKIIECGYCSEAVYRLLGTRDVAKFGTVSRWVAYGLPKVPEKCAQCDHLLPAGASN